MSVNRRRFVGGVGAALLAALAGCSSGSGSDTPPRTPRGTATPTPTPTFVSTPTAIPTATPEPTPTRTPDPTPTPTPEPEDVEVGLRRWGAMSTAATTVEWQVNEFREVDRYDSFDVRERFRDEAPLTPPEGETWVEADVRVRNVGDDGATVSSTQWTMRDGRNVGRSPDFETMRRVTGTLSTDRGLGRNSSTRERMIFSTPDPAPQEFIVRPYRGTSGPAVRILP